MKLTASHTASILYLLAALTTLGIWYVLLFTNNSSCSNPIDDLLYFLNEPPSHLIFRWLLVLPVLCLLLASAYFSKLPQTRMGSFGLFGVGTVLALATWLTVAPVAIFVSLPLWYAFVILRQRLTLHSCGTGDKAAHPSI